MRTGRTKSTLLARLERLEFRAAVFRKFKARFGNLHRLPRDYNGERHLVIARHLPSRSGQEWVEFEEVPGPDRRPELPGNGQYCGETVALWYGNIAHRSKPDAPLSPTFALRGHFPGSPRRKSIVYIVKFQKTPG